MVLGAFDIFITQREAARLAKTDKEFGRSTGEETGTMPENIVAVFRSYGLTVKDGENFTIDHLRAATTKNIIPIILFTERQMGWGHYAIVDTITNLEVTLIDPAETLGRHTMTVEEFERRWQDPLLTKTNHWAAFVSARG